MAALQWEQVLAWRLGRHHLRAPAPRERLVDVVGEVCGIHAQVMASAELSLGLRVAGATRRDVAAALWEERRLVKTYGLRGTVHLFSAAELPLWMAALKTNRGADEARLRQQGLDAGRLEAVVEAIGEALDGRRLTREELGDEIGRRAGAWAVEPALTAFGGKPAPRWTGAIGAACAAGRLCFGPNQGNKVTFVRPDQWLGVEWREVEPREALAEVLRRYLGAYGPATPDEFWTWFYLPPRVAREAFERLRGEIAEVEVEGERRWVRTEDAASFGPVERSAHLLSTFDVYVVGGRPRDVLVPPVVAGAAEARGMVPKWSSGRATLAAGTVPALLVDGRAAGTWRREKAGKRLELRVDPFAPLDDAHVGMLEAAAARVGAVLESEVTLVLGATGTQRHL